MTNQPARYTSDHILNESGMRLYANHIRENFRGLAEDFRILGIEVHEDLMSDPIPGDNGLQRRLHASQVSRTLRAMEDHARKIVALAKRLEKNYLRNYVELPKTRAEKELHKGQQASLTARTAEHLNTAASSALGIGNEQPAAAKPQPTFDLFKDVA